MMFDPDDDPPSPQRPDGAGDAGDDPVILNVGNRRRRRLPPHPRPRNGPPARASRANPERPPRQRPRQPHPHRRGRGVGRRRGPVLRTVPFHHRPDVVRAARLPERDLDPAGRARRRLGGLRACWWPRSASCRPRWPSTPVRRTPTAPRCASTVTWSRSPTASAPSTPAWWAVIVALVVGVAFGSQFNANWSDIPAHVQRAELRHHRPAVRTGQRLLRLHPARPETG